MYEEGTYIIYFIRRFHVSHSVHKNNVLNRLVKKAFLIFPRMNSNV